MITLQNKTMNKQEKKNVISGLLERINEYLIDIEIKDDKILVLGEAVHFESIGDLDDDIIIYLTGLHLGILIGKTI